jgi:hypothetical protein
MEHIRLTLSNLGGIVQSFCYEDNQLPKRELNMTQIWVAQMDEYISHPNQLIAKLTSLINIIKYKIYI